MTTDARAALPLGSISASEPHEPVASERFRARAARVDFERLALEYRPDLYRFAFWLTRDAAVAEDAVQEALLRAWQSWASLREKSSAKHWFLTIVRRECARMFERKRHQMSDIDELTAAEQYLIAVEDDSGVRDIQSAILRLDASYREPLILQVLMGYSTQEIAEIMGINRGAVLTRLCRARRKLSEQIEGP
jgi:RNA polymerase sigma-70 factor (ECF subfamily)